MKPDDQMTPEERREKENAEKAGRKPGNPVPVNQPEVGPVKQQAFPAAPLHTVEDRARLNLPHSTVPIDVNLRQKKDLFENHPVKLARIRQILKDKGMDSQQVEQALILIENVIWGEPEPGPIVGPGPAVDTVSLITEPNPVPTVAGPITTPIPSPAPLPTPAPILNPPPTPPRKP